MTSPIHVSQPFDLIVDGDHMDEFVWASDADDCGWYQELQDKLAAEWRFEFITLALNSSGYPHNVVILSFSNAEDRKAFVAKIDPVE